MNYTLQSRTNYFRVRDPKRFERWCRYFGIRFWKEQKITGRDDIFYALGKDDGEGWPTTHPETDEEIDFETELMKHLDPRDIAVSIQTGAEGLRFLDGYAVALHADGRTVQVQLYDIYEKAQMVFGPRVTITEAVY
jgi:hypothetical protein